VLCENNGYEEEERQMKSFIILDWDGKRDEKLFKKNTKKVEFSSYFN
jgi:hypothetical protein